MSLQSRSGGGGKIHTVGYAGSQSCRLTVVVALGTIVDPTLGVVFVCEITIAGWVTGEAMIEVSVTVMSRSVVIVDSVVMVTLGASIGPTVKPPKTKARMTIPPITAQRLLDA